jgi:hypothetical protein
LLDYPDERVRVVPQLRRIGRDVALGGAPGLRDTSVEGSDEFTEIREDPLLLCCGRIRHRSGRGR